MALTDLTLLYPTEYVVGQTSNPSNVRAEFEQLITRSNDVKDIAEAAAADIGTDQTRISALETDVGVLQTEMDDVEAAIATFSGHGEAYTVLTVSGDTTMDLASMEDYSVLRAQAGADVITLGDPASLEGRLFYIYSGGADGVAVDVGDHCSWVTAGQHIHLRAGDCLVVLVHTFSLSQTWNILALQRADHREVTDVERIALATGETQTLDWASPRAQSITLSDTSGHAHLVLPAISDQYVGAEFTVMVGCQVGEVSSQTLQVATSGGDRIGKTTLDLSVGEAVVLRALPWMNYNGSSVYSWAAYKT